WLAARKELGVRAAAPVFCLITDGKVGQPMEASAVRHMMKRRGAKGGIAKRVHAHALRHRHATELDRRGLPLRAIADQLGHASVSTTDVYLRKLSPHRRVELIRAAFDGG